MELRKLFDLPLGAWFRYRDTLDTYILLDKAGNGLVCGAPSNCKGGFQGVYAAAESPCLFRELTVEVVEAAPVTTDQPRQDAMEPPPMATTIEEAARDVGKCLNELGGQGLDLRHVAMLVHHVQQSTPKEETDSMGIPPCGGPLCAPGSHHQLCDLELAQNPPRVPRFPRLALRKLADLQKKGHFICGVMIQRAEPDGTITRGAVSDGGMVIWWNHSDTWWSLYEELRTAIDAGSETATHANAIVWAKSAHQILADVGGLTLTDPQCDVFRRLPMPFSDMVRAIHRAGVEHRIDPGKMP